MSIVGGLVGTGVEHAVAERRSITGEWIVRNAWSVILTGSLAFWLTIAGLLFWR